MNHRQPLLASMDCQTQALEAESLAQTFDRVLKAPDDEATVLTLGALVDTLGTRGVGLLLLILSLPSALPIPAPGYSTPFGLAIALLALQLLIHRKQLWLPASLRRRVIKTATAQKLRTAGLRVFGKTEHLIRPRWRWMLTPLSRTILASVVLLMGLLMILPIPLTNTAPAIVVFIISLSLAEEDGLWSLGGLLLGILAVLFYAAIIIMILVYGPEIIDSIKPGSSSG
jgi:hypothetical protein